MSYVLTYFGSFPGTQRTYQNKYKAKLVNVDDDQTMLENTKLRMVDLNFCAFFKSLTFRFPDFYPKLKSLSLFQKSLVTL